MVGQNLMMLYDYYTNRDGPLDQEHVEILFHTFDHHLADAYIVATSYYTFYLSRYPNGLHTRKMRVQLDVLERCMAEKDKNKFVNILRQFNDTMVSAAHTYPSSGHLALFLKGMNLKFNIPLPNLVFEEHPRKEAILAEKEMILQAERKGEESIQVYLNQLRSNLLDLP